jgi:hypothetical protein
MISLQSHSHVRNYSIFNYSLVITLRVTSENGVTPWTRSNSRSYSESNFVVGYTELRSERDQSAVQFGAV